MSISGGVYNAILAGHKAGCDVVQLFTKQSNQWKAKVLTDEEIERFYKEQKATKVKAVCAHTSYLINLGSPDDKLFEKSRESFKVEIQRCDILGIPNLVIHPGSHVGSGEEAGLKRIADAINKTFEEMPDSKTVVCLETTAGQGTNLGYKFEQLAEIIEMVEDKERMGVCMDSCHIFAAGYHITDPVEFKATVRQFDSIIGLNKLKIFHLNDSKKPHGSKRDRHQHIGQGEMGIEPFRNIINERRFARVPMILETPKGDDLKEDMENLAVLRSLKKR